MKKVIEIIKSKVNKIIEFVKEKLTAFKKWILLKYWKVIMFFDK